MSKLNKAQLSATELSMVLRDSEKKVRVGGTYVHYRSPDKPYVVLHVALLEADEEPCVVYQALYGDRLIWVRSLSKFLDLVDSEGQKVPRFKEI